MFLNSFFWEVSVSLRLIRAASDERGSLQVKRAGLQTHLSKPCECGMKLSVGCVITGHLLLNRAGPGRRCSRCDGSHLKGTSQNMRGTKYFIKKEPSFIQMSHGRCLVFNLGSNKSFPSIVYRFSGTGSQGQDYTSD